MTGRTTRLPSSAARGAGLLALALLAGACFGGPSEPKRPGSALWLAAESGELASADQVRLAAVGLTEVFLEAATLSWGADAVPTLEQRRLPRVPRRTPTTLVVSGPWLPGEREPSDVADRLHSALLARRIEAEQSDLLVVGYHLEVDPAERGEHYAKTLASLRRRLDGKAFLSIGIDRRALESEWARAAAESCDFVASFLYGQRPSEPEDPDAWDLEAVEGTFRKLEALRRPYFTGAIILGTASLRARGRAETATTTELGLGELVNSRRLELRPGFSLQGIDRQVFEFAALEPTSVGEWRLERGDVVRVVKTATPLVEEFRRRVGAWESPLRLGDLYYRLPRADERLSLSARNLETVLGPASSEPELALAVERSLATKDRWVLRVRLENRSEESSDLSFFDNNYVQLEVTGAVITDAEPGEFRRLDLFRDGERGTMQALRAANQVRLYLPLLEGGQRAASGPIELAIREAEPEALVSASFLLPSGRLLNTDPIDWSFETP
jgi:hypothetical protein